MPYTPHGGLLVPYPEEMANAARPKPPSWVPVVIFTLLLGVLTPLIGLLGAISAARRAARARRTRNDRHPYWIAFVATMAVSIMTWAIVLAILTPVYLNFREETTTKAVASNVVNAAKGAKAATCQPRGSRNADGLRTYRCTVKLTSGKSRTMQVKADERGNLQPAG